MKIEPFAIERWFARYEFVAKYNLGESCVQSYTLGELLALTRTPIAEITNQAIGYGESNGSLELRQAIASLYPNTTAANVLVTIGAIEANFLALNALIQPGDTVICEFPAYQQLYSVPAAAGATVKRWELRADEDYEPNLERLRELIDDKTRLVIINHPHNPTGKSISTRTLAAIAKMAEDAGAVLYSDEVYRGLTLHDELVSPSARSSSGRTVIVGSMSKAYGLPGLRVGWIVADEELIEQCWEFRDYTSICTPPLSEKLATLALQNHEAVLGRNRQIALRNFAMVTQWLESLDGLITWCKPDEGVIGFPRLQFTDDSAEFCEHLVSETGVLLVPGTCFERPQHVRLGFGYDSAKLEKGLEIVGNYIRKYRRS